LSEPSPWLTVASTLGSTRDSRVGCGDSLQRTLPLKINNGWSSEPDRVPEKVRDGEVAIARTRVACAPQTICHIDFGFHFHF
jgi:hypothetical protein